MIGVVLCVFVFALAAWAQQKNPLIGTWKTNPAKSKVILGGPGINQAVTYEASGPNGIKYTSERTDEQGQTSRIEFTANLDGKTYPYKGSETRDGISLTPIDSHSIRVSYKLRGETTQINYWIVSQDGKTLTTVSTGGNPVYVRLVVADKQ